MTLSNRLKELRGSLNLSQTQFASAVGTATSTYQHYERGEREATEKFLVNTITAFGLNPSWLMTGAGQMFNSSASGDKQLDGTVPVYVSSIAACCGPGPVTYPTEFLDEKIVVNQKHLGAIVPDRFPYAIQTAGRSMVGYGIEEDSLVVVNPAENLHSGHIALAVIDKKASIKKIYERDGGIDFVSFTGSKLHVTPKELADPEFIRILGRVMLVIAPPHEGV